MKLAELPEIQGKRPDSKEEVWVAMALDKLKIPYIYQFDLFGTARIRGGIVIDFLLLRPFTQALEIQGEYWHTGQFSSGDRLRKAIIEAEGIPVMYLWTVDLPTEEETYSKVKGLIL